MVVEITPTGVEAPLIEFNIVGVGKFHLPVLGGDGVPLNVTSAFGFLFNAQSDVDKVQGWLYLSQALADSYPAAARTIGRLGADDAKQVMSAWREQSDAYDPNRESSPR